MTTKERSFSSVDMTPFGSLHYREAGPTRAEPDDRDARGFEMNGSESFDVIVVGARCAGSPLATLLARAGVRVVVIEQATFPRDTLSTHCLHADALAFLDRLGVTEQVRATGA